MTPLYERLSLRMYLAARRYLAAKYMQQSATARALGDEQLAARYAYRAADYLVE